MSIFFWNNHKPKSLDDIHHNNYNITLLKNLAGQNIQHLYLCGLTTDYNRHLIELFIKYSNPDKLEIKKINLVLTSSITAEIKCSQYHYEFDMNYYKYMRRDIPLLIIDKIVKHKNVSTNSYHIIVIQNADYMTFNVQAAFRRLMEVYVRSCRFIFICSKTNGLISAIKSRCLTIALTKPTRDEYKSMLGDICKSEKLKIQDKILDDIYDYSEGIIDGVNLLQLYSLNNDAIQYKRNYSPYNEIYFYIKKGDIRYFKKIQNILFTLHSLDVSYTDIIKNILKKMIKDKSLTNKQKSKLVGIGAESEWNCVRSNRAIIGLNVFVVECIKVLEKKS